MGKIQGGVLPAVIPALTKYTADPERIQWVSSLYASFNALKLIVAQVQQDLNQFQAVSEAFVSVDFYTDRGSQRMSRTFYTTVSTMPGLTCYVKGGAAYELMNDDVNSPRYDKAFQPLDLHNFVDPTGDFDINVLSPRLSPESVDFLFGLADEAVRDMEGQLGRRQRGGSFVTTFPTFDFKGRQQMNPLVTAQLQYVFASLQRHVQSALASRALTLSNLQPMTVNELKDSLRSSMNVNREALRAQSGFMHAEVGLFHIVSFYNDGTFPRVMLCAKVGNVIDHVFDFMVPDEIHMISDVPVFDYSTATFWTADDQLHTIHIMAPHKLMQDNFEALMERRLKLLYESGADPGETMLKAFNHLGRMMFLLEVARSNPGAYTRVMEALTQLEHLPLLVFNNGVYTQAYPRVDLPDSQSLVRHLLSLDFTVATFPFYKLLRRGDVEVKQIPLPVLLNAYGNAFPNGTTGFPPFDALLDPRQFAEARRELEAIVEGNGRQRMANMNAMLRSISGAAADMDYKRYKRQMAANALRSDIQYVGSMRLLQAQERQEREMQRVQDELVWDNIMRRTASRSRT